jgi:phosphoglycerate dehydrogenase-like enzyme
MSDGLLGQHVHDTPKLVNREESLTPPTEHPQMWANVLYEELVAASQRRARLLLSQRDPWDRRDEGRGGRRHAARAAGLTGLIVGLGHIARSFSRPSNGSR